MQSADEGSRSPASRVGFGETVFRSLGWPVTRWFFIRVWLVYVVLVAGVAFFANASFWRDPLSLGFVLFFPMIAPLIMTRSPKGEIHVTHEGITLNASRIARYSWADVESLRLTSGSEAASPIRALCRVLGIDLRREFLEMKLRSSVRYNPVSENMSTRGFGVPTHLKKVSLFPDDPRALLAAVEVHLQPGIHS